MTMTLPPCLRPVVCAALLVVSATAAAHADDYLYQRQEGSQRGWDYFDPGGFMQGYSEENSLGGLDYRDTYRAWDGRSEVKYMGQLIERTPDDALINLNFSDYNDGYMYIQNEGNFYWQAVNNYTGGRDFYDEFGIIHASSNSLYYNWYYSTDDLPYTELKVTHMDEWGY